jgi:fumarate reductase flavoprotein subunit
LVHELALSYVGVDMIKDPVPVRPVVHYMMGGIASNIDGETPMPGLYAIGETACGSLNGANRLGSNSLTELLVFGKRAAAAAAAYANAKHEAVDEQGMKMQAENVVARVRGMLQQNAGSESISGIRREMQESLEQGAGIYRDAQGTETSCTEIADLQSRSLEIEVNDKSNVFNTDLQGLLELQNMLDVAECVAEASKARKESRGAHQRLDFVERDDENYLKHSMAHRNEHGRPHIDWLDVTITRSPPGERNYSGENT